MVSRNRGKGVEALFAGRALVSLLKIFLLHPESRFYQRELERLSGEGLCAVQHELQRLLDIGLIVKIPSGNRRYYHLNKKSAVFPELKALFMKTVLLKELLAEGLVGLGARIKVAFIYGSMARGEDQGDSDLDLMLIGSVTARESGQVLASIKEALGREINLVIFSTQEFRKNYALNHHFIHSVIKEPKIFLIGDQDELAKISS